MGFSYGRLPVGPLRQLLERRGASYTIYAEDGDTNGWSDSGSSLTSLTTAQIDVYGHQTRPESYPTGDDYQSSLQGLMDAREKTADIENGVCIVHGGTVYEVTLDPWPAADNAVVYTLSLNERSDIATP